MGKDGVPYPSLVMILNINVDCIWWVNDGEKYAPTITRVVSALIFMKFGKANPQTSENNLF